MKKDNFTFNLNAKRIRITDDEILSSVKEYAQHVNYRYFPSTEYDKWKNKKAHSCTIIERFGSWKKIMSLLGIEGGRERRYTPAKLIENLEKIWKQLGYPPGKRQIKKYGFKISESPYKYIWGSVRSACEYLADFHNGKITREELLKGNTSKSTRRTVPLKTRWEVLKRDHYKCVKCGRGPATHHNVLLEVDHDKPVSKRGDNDIANLQTLCQDCNQGKKDKE